MTTLRNYGLGLLHGVIYALVMWGIFALLGWPDIARDGHRLDLLVWIAVVYAMGYGSGLTAP